jgi:hypothetical protein
MAVSESSDDKNSYGDVEFDLPTSLCQQIQSHAAQQGVSAGEIMVRVLEQFLTSRKG